MDRRLNKPLVLAMVVGGPSQELIMQFSGQATGRGPAKPEFWGTLLAKNLPRTAVTQFMDRVRKVYLPRMMASAGGGLIGRVLPFGVGALVEPVEDTGERVALGAEVAVGVGSLGFGEPHQGLVLRGQVRVDLLGLPVEEQVVFGLADQHRAGDGLGDAVAQVVVECAGEEPAWAAAAHDVLAVGERPGRGAVAGGQLCQ